MQAIQPLTALKPARIVTPAESACLAAVASQTGASDVSTLSVAPSQSGASVTVRVPRARAAWSCAYQGGKVVSVSYAGSEGKL